RHPVQRTLAVLVQIHVIKLRRKASIAVKVERADPGQHHSADSHGKHHLKEGHAPAPTPFTRCNFAFHIEPQMNSSSAFEAWFRWSSSPGSLPTSDRQRKRLKFPIG